MSSKGVSLAEVKEKYTLNGFCLVCGKGFQYPYGRHHREGELQSGTCSKVCEDVFDPGSAGFREQMSNLAGHV